MTSPIQFAIDFGEIEEAMQAIHAAGMALTEGVMVERAVYAFENFSDEEFDKFIDQEARANPAQLSHVYEYGEVGDPTGRLWRMRWRSKGGNAVAQVEWLDSRRPVPIHPEIKADADANNEELATHYFPSKAMALETGPEQYTIRAGSREFMERKGGGREPKSLVMWNGNKVVFARAATQVNRHAGQFQLAWERFFEQYSMQVVRQEIDEAMRRRIAPTMEREIDKTVRAARAASKPRISSTEKRSMYTTVKGKSKNIDITPSRSFFRKAKNIIERFVK